MWALVAVWVRVAWSGSGVVAGGALDQGGDPHCLVRVGGVQAVQAGEPVASLLGGDRPFGHGAEVVEHAGLGEHRQGDAVGVQHRAQPQQRTGQPAEGEPVCGLDRLCLDASTRPTRALADVRLRLFAGLTRVRFSRSAQCDSWDPERRTQGRFRCGWSLGRP